MNKVAILLGSVFGAAEELAEHLEKQLKAASIEVALFDDKPLTSLLAYEPTHWIIITSTTGMGDVPDNLLTAYDELNDSELNLSHAQYAVVALGDSSYVDSFCGAGEKFDQLMQDRKAVQCLPLFKIDACETMDPITFAESWLAELQDKI